MIERENVCMLRNKSFSGKSRQRKQEQTQNVLKRNSSLDRTMSVNELRLSLSADSGKNRLRKQEKMPQKPRMKRVNKSKTLKMEMIWTIDLEMLSIMQIS